MGVQQTIPHGTLLSGKYRVGRELGRGGMAAVYEAANVDIGKRVAIKLLAGHLAASQTVVERFLREARAVAKIRSPHICDVYDVDRLDDGTPYLVLELLEGESLYEAMVRDRQMSSHLTLAIILQVSRGLQKAHSAQIVHRDLKPENLFLTVNDDGQLLVKVLDFGLAKFYDPMAPSDKKQARLTREGAVFGTPAYMSPEQVRGQAAADTRADLWALACITYECFTGATVWSTEDGVAMTFAQIATSPLPNPAEFRPDLPPAFSAWFKKALDRDIKKRFQTVEEFATALVRAFDYDDDRGLDANLVNRITTQATADPDAITQRGRTSGQPPRKPPPKKPARSAPKQQSKSPEPVALGREAGISLPPESLHSRGRVSPKLVAGGLVGVLLVLLAVALATGERTQELVEAQRVSEVIGQLGAVQATRRGGFPVVQNHAWLPRVREAQSLIAQGEHERAEAMLRRVLDESKHAMVRNLLDQVGIAKEAKESGAGCQVTGYARPRRYDLLGQDRVSVSATPPVVAHTINGPVVAWSDTRDGQRRAFAVPLDDALRNVGLSVDITPEGFSVATPVLTPVAQRMLATYWDSGGGEPGVYLRWLGPDAVIAGSPVLVSEKQPGAYQADTARADDGFVVAWTGRGDLDSVDVFLRSFDARLSGTAQRRLTDYVGRSGGRPRARDVQVDFAAGRVHVVYAFNEPGLRQVRFQSLSAKGEGLTGTSTESRSVGKELIITDEGLSGVAPSLGCTGEGCFVAWHNPQGGAGVAFVDIAAGKVQWHKHFTTAGKYPSVAVSASGKAQLAWVENGRLTTATLGRKGVGPHSKVARIVADHAPPAIAPAGRSGEWYIGWLDFETGHQEPYVARILCQ